MKLSQDDVLKLGTLSRIEISAEELPELQADLNRTLNFAAILQQVDPDLKAFSFDFGGNILRNDELQPTLGQAGATAIAPDAQDGFLKVPRTVDTGGHGG